MTPARCLHTGVGELDLRLPQVRDCAELFRPLHFEKSSRVARLLNAAIAEM